MSSYSTINNNMYAILKSVLDVSASLILPQNANRTQPDATLYYVYNIDCNPVGETRPSEPSAAGISNMYNAYNCILFLEAYGDGAKNALYDFHNKLYLDENKALLREKEISIKGSPVFRDLTALEETYFEERCQLELNFSTIANTTDTISFIEEINGSTELNDYENTFLG
jgi:hypothetical protein